MEQSRLSWLEVEMTVKVWSRIKSHQHTLKCSADFPRTTKLNPKKDISQAMS